MFALSDSEEIMSLSIAVWPQSTNVTDRRQTTDRPVAIPTHWLTSHESAISKCLERNELNGLERKRDACWSSIVKTNACGTPNCRVSTLEMRATPLWRSWWGNSSSIGLQGGDLCQTVVGMTLPSVNASPLPRDLGLGVTPKYFLETRMHVGLPAFWGAL